jgi:hypothetical protein
VIAELAGWFSDLGEVVVGINMDQAQNSNEFSLADGPLSEADTDNWWQTVDTSTASPTICAVRNLEKKYGGGQERDCYQYLGRSKGGLTVLSIGSYESNATASFQNLLIIEEQQDQNIGDVRRHLLVSRGQIWIGDRVPVEHVFLKGDRITIEFRDRPSQVFELPPASHVNHVSDNGRDEPPANGGQTWTSASSEQDKKIW